MPTDAPANAKRVLLVQDDVDEENVALRALGRCGIPMQVVVARDGSEAVEILFGEGLPESGPWRPDLVMLDLGLPKLDGIEVLQRIRSQDQTAFVPIVITSGSQDPTRIRKALVAGANSVLTETIDYEAHIESIILAAKYWLQAHRAVMI
jgi:CheY-like chemotaxis protein